MVFWERGGAGLIAGSAPWDLALRFEVFLALGGEISVSRGSRKLVYCNTHLADLTLLAPFPWLRLISTWVLHQWKSLRWLTYLTPQSWEKLFGLPGNGYETRLSKGSLRGAQGESLRHLSRGLVVVSQRPVLDDSESQVRRINQSICHRRI